MTDEYIGNGDTLFFSHVRIVSDFYRILSKLVRKCVHEGTSVLDLIAIDLEKCFECGETINYDRFIDFLMNRFPGLISRASMAIFLLPTEGNDVQITKVSISHRQKSVMCVLPPFRDLIEPAVLDIRKIKRITRKY